MIFGCRSAAVELPVERHSAEQMTAKQWNDRCSVTMSVSSLAFVFVDGDCT